MRGQRVSAVVLTVVTCIATPASAQSEDPMNPNWGAHHTTERAYTLLEGWAVAYPDLIRLYSIGETLQGTPLMVLDVLLNVRLTC
jgi:hypothetical protein